MPTVFRSAGRTIGILVAVIAAALLVAVVLFGRAFPMLELSNRIPRSEALAKADSVFAARGLARAGSRRAVSFASDDSLQTFVDFAGGGRDSLNALARGRDVAPFTWSVRAFTPLDPHEARVDFDPTGRLVGFNRKLAESDVRPALSPDSARTAADAILTGWLGEAADRWRLATASYETQKTSGRIDRKFTYERVGRTVAGAPIRLDIVIAGDLPSRAHRYVVIPESFKVRYSEMRSLNELLEIIDTVAIFALFITVVVVLRFRAREGAVRWMPAFVVGGVIAVLLVAAGLNDSPLSWFAYDTATSPTIFAIEQAALAVAGGITMGVVVGLTLAAAEASARRAFPEHLDWWKLWTYRGSPEVGGRVLGGYAVAAILLAYEVVFYLTTRKAFGWWVPTEMLDDPNLIATPLPWISGISLALQAGVWEETLFRVLPLALLAFWAKGRPRYRWWMAGGVVVTALVFGFAHSNYTSWPPYSRGVEIFLDAAFWAVLVLVFGALVTVVGHFLYDLTMFGLFAVAGHGLAYQLSAVVIGAALLAPLAAVLWKWVRQRALIPVPAAGRFSAWTPRPPEPVVVAVPKQQAVVLGRRSAQIALAVAALSLAGNVIAPADPVLGPRFTASRERVITVADSMLTARGGAGDLSTWRRLTGVGTDTLPAWSRFLHQNHAEPLAQTLSRTYQIPTWWTVRYVHTSGPLTSRIEEWRVRVAPDGKPIDLRHIVPDSAPGASPTPDEARRVARMALVNAGFDTLRLQETAFEATPKSRRQDATIIYTDTSIALPDSAVARVSVSLAGTDPLVVRRGIKLPDGFIRSDKLQQDLRVALLGVSGLLLMGSLITGVVLIIRGRPRRADDALLGRRGLTWVVVILAATLVLAAINGLPAFLFGYDTSNTWNTFTSGAAVALVFAMLPALLVLGLWLVTSALRQRVGISAGALDADAPDPRTIWLAGLGLGALLALISLVPPAVASELPPPPHTALDAYLPWLSAALALPVSVAGAVAGGAIPFLVIGGASDRTRVRVLLAILLAMLVAGVGAGATGASGHGVSVTGVVLGIVALASFVVAIPTWGAVSVLTWVVAMLSQEALSAIHNAVRASTAAERLGQFLAALVALALLTALYARHARIHRSRFGQAPGSH